jgi:hypothetical protein
MRTGRRKNVRTTLRRLCVRRDRCNQGLGGRRDAGSRCGGIRIPGTGRDRFHRLRDRDDRVVRRVAGGLDRSLILRVVRLILRACVIAVDEVRWINARLLVRRWIRRALQRRTTVRGEARSQAPVWV